MKTLLRFLLLAALLPAGVLPAAGQCSISGLATGNSSQQQYLSGSTTATFINSSCGLIASVQPIGLAGISGTTTASVWLDAPQPLHYVRRYYEITPALNAATASGTVTLYYTQQDFDAFNAVSVLKLPLNPADAENYKTNLLIEKRAGTSSGSTGRPNSYAGSPVEIKPSSVTWNATDSRWEVRFSTNGFSGFFARTALPLPVTLVAFSGKNTPAGNALYWQTAAEEHNAGFEVQYLSLIHI